MSTLGTEPRAHAATALPEVVDPEEWQRARDALLVKEKAHTRAGDALAAERRRLPMVEVDAAQVLVGPDGPLTLLDMFEGRRQLVVYHHMLTTDDEHPCAGCAAFGDAMGNLAHLHANDTTLALVAVAPSDQIEAFKRRMGWTMPFYSWHDNPEFGERMNLSPWAPTSFGLGVYLRDGSRVFRTYFTIGRGVEHLSSGATMLDITPFGRQQSFEDSPEGWPQAPTYSRGGLHDEYSDADLRGENAPSSTGATTAQ